MVAGTSVGAGIWAIPAVTAQLGFVYSSICLVLAWFVMFLSAKMLQHVNGFLPPKSNFLGMVSWSLGPFARGLCWVVYLCLLYMLMAAYLTGLADVLGKWTGFSMVHWLIIIGLFSMFFFTSIHITNKVSGWLMWGLFLSFLLFLSFMSTHLQPVSLLHYHWDGSMNAFTIILAAFGYQIILPSLREFLDDDLKLSQVIFWGSLIPLVIYIVWEAWMFMSFPQEGALSMNQITSRGNPNVVIPSMLVQITQNQKIRFFAEVFSFFTIATSFIGVAQSLVDFLKEGLAKSVPLKYKNCLASFCGYSIPLLFALIYPKGFILALSYAGQLVAILLLGFPVVMFWAVVRCGKIAPERVFGLLIGSVLVMACALLLLFSSHG